MLLLTNLNLFLWGKFLILNSIMKNSKQKRGNMLMADEKNQQVMTSQMSTEAQNIRIGLERQPLEK